MHNSEINFLVESTLIQLETGGNLVVLFQRTAHLLEEKQKLRFNYGLSEKQLMNYIKDLKDWKKQVLFLLNVKLFQKM